jgi:hypothetical protein
MPNATKQHSRRAALGALASVPALAPPLGAMAAPAEAKAAATSDAALLALIDAARDLGARWQSACDAAEAASCRTEDVPWPQALIATEEDARVWPFAVG